MKQFVLARQAERDPDQIKRFLLQKAGPTAARKVLKHIRGALMLLGNDPGAGHVREDLTSRPVEILARVLLPDRLRSGDQACPDHSSVARNARRRGNSELTLPGIEARMALARRKSAGGRCTAVLLQCPAGARFS